MRSWRRFGWAWRLGGSCCHRKQWKEISARARDPPEPPRAAKAFNEGPLGIPAGPRPWPNLSRFPSLSGHLIQSISAREALQQAHRLDRARSHSIQGSAPNKHRKGTGNIVVSTKKFHNTGAVRGIRVQLSAVPWTFSLTKPLATLEFWTASWAASLSCHSEDRSQAIRKIYMPHAAEGSMLYAAQFRICSAGGMLQKPGMQ